MGKNIVTMVVALFAVLAVLGIIYAVNNINPNSPRPFEDVLIPEEGETSIIGENETLVVPEELMPGANTLPERTPAPETILETEEPVISEEESGDEEEAIFCTMDAMMCPDGSFVGRTAPDCAFAPCPGE